jgi:DNA-binding IclR family transcriptional regulator
MNLGKKKTRLSGGSDSMPEHSTEISISESVESGFPIRSVGKAMAILHAICASQRPLRVTDLAKRLNMSSSGVSRLVSTLAEGGLIEQEEDTGRCYLGFGLAVLGNAALGRRDLDRLAAPVMAEISARFVEYVSLSRLHRGSVVTMRSRATESLHRDVKLICVMPMHASAPGKVLAAWLDPEDLNSILETIPLDSFTPKTITSVDSLMTELEKVRSQGFAIDDQELVHGARHVATPIRDHHGDVVAAISAGGFARKVHGEELDALTRAIAQGSLEISRQLGYDDRLSKSATFEPSAPR